MSTMCHNCGTKRARRSRQRGVSIIAAIFLLMLMAGLAALMATVTTSQNTTSTQDLLGSRAYQAARAGLEWGIYRALRDNSCVASSNLPQLADDLGQFTVVVSCTAIATTEANNNVTVYQIVSVASSGTIGSPHFVERRLEVVIS